jgi:uncharacterized membrane protein
MKNFLKRIWTGGVISTFVTGLLALLPIVITVAIVGWVAGYLVELLGPDTLTGRALGRIGRELTDNEKYVTPVAWLLVLVLIWVLGLILRTRALSKIESAFTGVLRHLPIIGAVYKPVSEVVGLLKVKSPADMKAMSVVHCNVPSMGGTGFIGLLASSEVYELAGGRSQMIYMPSSPFPMTGWLILVPERDVHRIDMSVDDVMKIYFSLGVLTPQVMPEGLKVPPPPPFPQAPVPEA